MKKILLLVLLGFARLSATTHWFDSAPFTTYGDFNPLPLNTTTDSGHTVKQLQPGQGIRFAAKTTTVVMRAYISTAAGRRYEVLQGALGTIPNTVVGSFDFPATGSGAYNNYTLASGLDNSVFYEYQIVCSLPQSGANGNWFDSNLQVDLLETSEVHPALKNAAMYGDSITSDSNGYQTDTSGPFIGDYTGSFSGIRFTDMWQFCHATGLQMYIVGTPGGKTNPNGRDSTGAIPAASDIVYDRYSTNDLIDLSTGGGQSAFQTAKNLEVANIRTQIGAGKPIVVWNPLPRLAGGGNRAICATLIQAAIAGMANVSYTGTDNWVPTSVSYQPNEPHPNAAGYAVLANREIPIFSAVSLILSGPSSGIVGSPSSIFTVALANTATFTGDQDVTITATGGNVTATAAGGSISGNGTGVVTATPASSGALTFTYTPTAGGNQTLTLSTTQQLWTMPSSVNYGASNGAPVGRPGTSTMLLTF